MPGKINKAANFSIAGKSVEVDNLYGQLVGPYPRRALGRAITLVESTRPEDRERADRLLDLVTTNNPSKDTFRLGVSGTPGVGKSTFIEQFGLEAIGAGHRLAVLAVDPTSSVSGGSILGDKTRMETLSRHPAAYIRPSPTAGYLGGVNATSRAAVALCEAAGYDYVIVETVGVGQSEWRVHGMTDAFLLLAQPAAGDDLQSIKRGILELADYLLVNKADTLPEAAKESARQLRRGLHLAPARADDWTVKVDTISAATGQGLPEALRHLARYRQHSVERGAFSKRRVTQREAWFRERVEQSLRSDFERFLSERGRTTEGLRRIIEGRQHFSEAARSLLAEFYQSKLTN